MAAIPTFPASSTAPEIPVRNGLPEFDAELAAASIAALDRILVALILLGDEYEICHLNAAARRITEAEDGIQRCGRYLRFTNPFGRDNGPHGRDPERIFRVRRPSGAPDYIVTVFPARTRSVGYRIVSSIMLITDPAAIQICPDCRGGARGRVPGGWPVARGDRGTTQSERSNGAHSDANHFR
jgi:hypothetical protein